jgi:hypothetical protein
MFSGLTDKSTAVYVKNDKSVTLNATFASVLMGRFVKVFYHAWEEPLNALLSMRISRDAGVGSL